MVTIREVASVAGVSLTTVSHALSGNGRVAEQTRERVIAAAQQVGYTPNLHAQSLHTQRTNTIALVIPDNANPYYPQLVAGAEAVARDSGLGTVLCNTNYDVARAESYVTMLLGWVPDAVLYVLSSPDDVAWRPLVDRVPALVFCDEVPDPETVDAACVELDNALAGRLAARHLAGLGHERVCFIGDPVSMRAGRLRFEGFHDEFHALVAGGTVDALPAQYLVEDGRRAAGELVARMSDVTGVFCANDLLALGLITGLREAGRRVPDDLSVIGMDDVLPVEVMEPSLTTIAQPIHRIGARAAEIALGILDGREPASRIERFDPELRIRRSTGALA